MKNKEKFLNRKNGITLISLVITIVVLLIIAGASISMLKGENGIITNAQNAKFKQILAGIKEEYDIYISQKKIEDFKFDKTKLSAGATYLTYNGQKFEDGENISDIIKNTKDKELQNVQISKGILYYKTSDLRYMKLAKEMGFELNTLNVNNGVISSSEENLYIVDSDGVLDLTQFDDITSISEGAFCNVNLSGNANALKKIIIPGTVKVIKDDAFANNTQLEEVIIEDGVTSVGKRAFRSCTALKKIEFPDSVTYIGEYCLSNCTSLTEVKISSQITQINQRFCQGCTKLQKIEIPEGVQRIEYAAFSGCKELKEITLPKSLTYIQGTAIANLPKLTNIKINEGNTRFKFENGLLLSRSSDTGSFNTVQMALLSLTEINIPEGITSITGDTFSGSNATKIKLPSTLSSSINGTIFNGMNKLVTIDLNSSSKNLKLVNGNLYSYDGKRLIKYMGSSNVNFEVPEGVETLTCRCITKKLSGLKLPNTLKVIEGWALGSLSGVSLIEIPENVNTMYTYSFNGTTKLRVAENNSKYKSVDDTMILSKDGKTLLLTGGLEGIVNIPKSVQSLGSRAFYNNSRITEINIPNGVKEIGSECFYNCTKLNKVDVPKSVVSISDNVFVFCNNLVSINIDGKVGSIANSPWGCPIGARAINWTL